MRPVPPPSHELRPPAPKRATSLRDERSLEERAHAVKPEGRPKIPRRKKAHATTVGVGYRLMPVTLIYPEEVPKRSARSVGPPNLSTAKRVRESDPRPPPPKALGLHAKGPRGRRLREQTKSAAAAASEGLLSTSQGSEAFVTHVCLQLHIPDSGIGDDCGGVRVSLECIGSETGQGVGVLREEPVQGVEAPSEEPAHGIEAPREEPAPETPSGAGIAEALPPALHLHPRASVACEVLKQRDAFNGHVVRVSIQCEASSQPSEKLEEQPTEAAEVSPLEEDEELSQLGLDELKNVLAINLADLERLRLDLLQEPSGHSHPEAPHA